MKGLVWQDQTDSVGPRFTAFVDAPGPMWLLRVVATVYQDHQGPMQVCVWGPENREVEKTLPYATVEEAKAWAELKVIELELAKP
jgi:hypothetical protein